MATEPPKKRLKLSMDSFKRPLKVVVGHGKHEFYISKDLICSHSEYFKTQCNTITYEIILSSGDPVIFSIFLTWLTTMDIKNSSELIEAIDSGSDTAEHNLTKQASQIIQCMILGYILKAEEFSNAMMDILLALCFEHSRTYGKLLCSNAGKIKLIWECTSKSSPLRQFVIDNFFFTVSEEHTNSQFLDFDKDCEAHSIFREFYQEVVVRGMKAHRAGEKDLAVWERDRCTYHTHANQPKGYSCTKITKQANKATRSVVKDRIVDPRSRVS